MQIYFSDFFGVPGTLLEEYGAFNISLINDLPLFVDPFLLFNSKKVEYQQLHEQIIVYMRFLKAKATGENISPGLLRSWYLFPEVKQNWLGFSQVGNKGAGLRDDFAISLHNNLHAIFSNFGNENITRGSHLEKLCLIRDGVGRDKISDFTTNLIKEFLLNYTQTFAVQNIDKKFRRRVPVNKVRFNFKTETWETDVFDLPWYANDFIILTPKDILTKDELWINKDDLYREFDSIPIGVSNEVLRAQINNYFQSALPADRTPSEKEIRSAVSLVVNKFPEILDYYIRYKENEGDRAFQSSALKVKDAQKQYIEQIKELSDILRATTQFYDSAGNSYDEAYSRVIFLKNVIENKDGYRYFYVKEKPIAREEDIQIMYRLTWFATELDVNREVNNGRGPVDFKISSGKGNSTLVEFKLAKNTQLARNLERQVPIYEKASDTRNSIKVIIYFSEKELLRVNNILEELKLTSNPNIVLIDARKDNKVSASKA